MRSVRAQGSDAVKILLIDGSADTSSKDCMDGYLAALKRAGHEVLVYAANGRLNVAGNYLDYLWRKSQRLGEDRPRPTAYDSLYWAGIWSLEMALRTDPDVIIVMAGMYFSKLNMQLLRKASYPYSKMVLLMVDSPWDDNQAVNVLSLYDTVFVNERASLPIYRQYNEQSYYLPSCYSPERHHPGIQVDDDVPSFDVVFVGSAFRERVELLSAVDWTGINLGLFGNWSGLGSRSKLRQYVHGAVVRDEDGKKVEVPGAISNDYAAQLYRRAKICLNLYRTRLSHPPVPVPSGMAQSLNPRAYELAAVGVFQLSTDRAEALDLFGACLPTFKTAEELEREIRRYLAMPTTCQSMAQQQMRLVQGHTFDARVAQMMFVLEAQTVAA